MNWRTVLIFTALATGTQSFARTADRPGSAEPTAPKATEQWQPVPKVVTPGTHDAAPPSDAIVLFDGRDLDRWE
jgi:hypothetical protein